NDLAWRIATAKTGHTGAIVTSHAYHGVSAALADLSPEEWLEGFRPAHVETIAPPGAAASITAEMNRATAALLQRDLGLAATYLDCAFTSDGIFTPAPEHLQEIARLTRE